VSSYRPRCKPVEGAAIVTDIHDTGRNPRPKSEASQSSNRVAPRPVEELIEIMNLREVDAAVVVGDRHGATRCSTCWKR